MKAKAMKAISIRFAAALSVGVALSASALAGPFNNRGAMFADTTPSGSPTTPFETSERVALGGFNKRGPSIEFVPGAPNPTPWADEHVAARVSGGFNNRGNGVFASVAEKSYDFDNERVAQNSVSSNLRYE